MNSILIVDDNVHLIAVLAKMLEPIARVTFATGGRAALEQMRSDQPQLVLLDAEMPDMSGHEVCQAMRADTELDRVPVIFVTAHNDEEAEVSALAYGAVDFISKPVNEAILLARVKTQLRLKGLTDELRRSAAIDGLTCIANRGAFDERLRLECARAARTQGRLSLILLDVDHFKRFNDQYGHPEGDACLREVARALASQARRPADLAARIGGEEFALLLPDTDANGAMETAQRLRSSIAALALPHAASPTASFVTASIGVATCAPLPQHQHTVAKTLVEQADQALYKAKSEGRNQARAAPHAEHINNACA